MRMSPYFLLVPLMLNVLWAAPSGAQERSGTITGTVTDVSHAILPGATVNVDPGGASVVSNGQGEFTITGVAPGTYSLMVDYVGFSPSTTTFTVAPGQVVRVNPVLNIASASESVIVTAERAHGEAEAINEIRTAENVLNVLPADVIRSLPNPNIADALSRLPGVTLERDEGEGKYVQIRGTEPSSSTH